MTVKEKAGEYAEKTEAEYGFDMHPKTASFQGFIAGYTEAMRWRDPKIELPEINSRVLLKSETGYVEARTIRNWHILKSTLNVSIGGKKVIGWRPIE